VQSNASQTMVIGLVNPYITVKMEGNYHASSATARSVRHEWALTMRCNVT